MPWVGECSAEVFGGQAGHALLQDATHREEGSEDQDSISGVRLLDRSVEGSLGAGMGARWHVAPARQRLPARLQLLRGRGARGREVGEVPAIDQRADLL